MHEYRCLQKKHHSRAENLLHNILPRKIARKLRQIPGTIAESYADVTVGFADLVGFTELASRLTPHQLVNTLDELFRKFDAIIREEEAEKIKMIGDAYMFVVGAPQSQTDHARIAVRVSRKLKRAVDRFRKESGLAVEIRVGLASGTAVGGVICEHKFAFDLWGDTVNVAARMEQNANPGTILMTRSTYEHVAADYRGLRPIQINIKGKGEMEVYPLAPSDDSQPAWKDAVQAS